jgi:hypothetical protein
VCGIDPGEAYELLGGGAADIWSLEHRRQRGQTAADGGARHEQATERDGDARGHGEDQKLTTKLPIRSTAMIADEGEFALTDSGELLQRGMADSGRLRPPLLDSTHQDILGIEAELWASWWDLGRPLTTATGHGQS